VFSGFHPDICPLAARPDNIVWLSGKMGTLMSSIIIAAHHFDFTVDETCDLFNALVYAKLGYFERFDVARQLAIETYRPYGIDLEGAFEAWLREGPFMYSDNHPRIRVLGTLAHGALSVAGLAPRPLDGAPAPEDDLANSVQWPVVPALAQRLGVKGGTMFLRSRYEIGEHEQRELALKDMIAASYEVMNQYDKAELIYSPRSTGAIDALRELIAA
jgi:hypothetical protein